VEQELLTFLEHPSTIPVFGGFHIARSLVLSEVKTFLFYFSKFLKPYKLVQEKFEDTKEETKTQNQ
jgi:hypothetical protein